MYCQKCGANIKEGSRFCSDCGNELISVQQPQKGKNSTKWAVLLAALSLIFAITVVVTVFTFDLFDDSRDTDIVSVTPMPTVEPVKEPDEVVVRVEVEADNNSYVQHQTTRTPSKRQEFLDRAQGIEDYARRNIDTAVSQVDFNRESATVYNKWDTLLNDIWIYLKNTMPSTEFKTLEKDEVRWIKEKEAGIQAAVDEFGIGSGTSAARSSTGTSYTKDRVYYLISLVD